MSHYDVFFHIKYNMSDKARSDRFLIAVTLRVQRQV